MNVDKCWYFMADGGWCMLSIDSEYEICQWGEIFVFIGECYLLMVTDGLYMRNTSNSLVILVFECW